MHSQLIKGSRGFGFNIVGGSKPRELLQIYSVTASGPSDLMTGTVYQSRWLHENIAEMYCSEIHQVMLNKDIIDTKTKFNGILFSNVRDF